MRALYLFPEINVGVVRQLAIVQLTVAVIALLLAILLGEWVARR
jgi:hypothetical protein